MRVRERLTAMTTCPYCLDDVTAGPECPRCGARYHGACAYDLGTCAAYGCRGALAERAGSRPRTPARTAEPRADRSRLHLLVIGAIVALVVGLAAAPSPLTSHKLPRERKAAAVLQTVAEVQREHGPLARLEEVIARAPGRFPPDLVTAARARRPLLADGYLFDLLIAPDGWAARAWPDTPGESGDRSFAVRADGKVHFFHSPVPAGPELWPGGAIPVGR